MKLKHILRLAAGILLISLPAGAGYTETRSPKAYVAESGTSSLAVIDTESHQVLKHMDLPKGVHGVVVTPDGARVFVSSDESNIITAINTASDEIAGKIPTGKAPHGLALSKNGKHLYAAIFGDNQVLDIDVNSLKVLHAFDAPAPHNLAISPDNKNLYVAAQQPSKTGVAQIDVASGKTVKFVPTDKVPRSLNLSPDGSSLTVTEYDHRDLQVFSTSPLAFLTSVEVGESPHHTIFTPDGKLVLVCNQVTNDVALVDTKTWKVTGKIAVGMKPHWIAPSSDSEYAYVTDEASGQVSVLDLEEQKVEATITVGAAPRKIAIQPGSLTEAKDMADEKHATVKMQGPPPRFEPATLEIEAGTTVEWINTGSRVHTVTGDNANWDSGSLAPGEKFSKRFDEKGIYKYYCVPHRDMGMFGTIVVK